MALSYRNSIAFSTCYSTYFSPRIGLLIPFLIQMDFSSSMCYKAGLSYFWVLWRSQLSSLAIFLYVSCTRECIWGNSIFSLILFVCFLSSGAIVWRSFVILEF